MSRNQRLAIFYYFNRTLVNNRKFSKENSSRIFLRKIAMVFVRSLKCFNPLAYILCSFCFLFFKQILESEYNTHLRNHFLNIYLCINMGIKLPSVHSDLLHFWKPIPPLGSSRSSCFPHPSLRSSVFFIVCICLEALVNYHSYNNLLALCVSIPSNLKN